MLLQPEPLTARRDIYAGRLVPGRPLAFRMAGSEEPSVPDVLSAGARFVVHDKVRALIEQYQIFGMQLYHSVVIDLAGEPHHDFFFINVFAEQDFVNLDRSTAMEVDSDDEPDEDEDNEALPEDYAEEPFLYTYRFDPKKMDKVSLEHRMMFRLAGINSMTCSGMAI